MTNRIFRIFLAFIIFIACFNNQVSAQKSYRDYQAGTRIYFSTELNIFPRAWRNNQTAPKISSIGEDAKNRLKVIIGIALTKYPKKVLKRNLKRVYILRTMEFYGLAYGGTYYKRKVYITDNGLPNGYTNEYIEGTFHHEFSSVLMKRYKKHLDINAWHEANPTGFSYGEGGIEALKTANTGLLLDSALYKKGFLNEYSLASFEEDFNCFAEYLFLSDDGFWQAWEQSEAVRRKTEIIINFYNHIDSEFTLRYFRQLRAETP